MLCNDSQGLAIDIGSYKSSIGFIGCEDPRYVCNSIIGFKPDKKQVLYNEDIFKNKFGVEISPFRIGEKIDKNLTLNYLNSLISKLSPVDKKSPIFIVDDAYTKETKL